MRLRIILPLAALLLVLGAWGVFTRPLLAQPEATAVQRTVDAFISGALTQTAQPQPNMTQTLAAAFNAALTGTAAALATPTPTPTPTQEPFAASGLEVVNVRPYDLMGAPARTSGYLSPDGTRFAHRNATLLCVYTLDGEQEVCSPDDEATQELVGAVDNETVRWSPDGQWLVFTTNSLTFFEDGDIWVMNAATGEVTNLTDDNFDDIMFPEPEGPFFLDLGPIWSPDSAHVLFIRHNGLQGAPYLYRVPVTGGDAEQLGWLLNPEAGIASWFMAVAPDGVSIAYNVHTGGSENPVNGVYLYNPATRENRRLLENDPGRFPVSLSFSPDGRYLLVHEYSQERAQTMTTSPENSAARVISLESGEVQWVDPTRHVAGAGWSPTGSALVYIVRDFEDETNSGLYLTDAPGEPGRQVFEGALIIPTSEQQQPLVWSRDNKVLVTQVETYTLALIEMGDAP
jgi:Tol biopolymer transport system component